MGKINITDIITRYVGRLSGSIDDSTTTPEVTITAPYKQVDSGSGTFSNSFLDEVGVIMSADDSDKIEQMTLENGVDNGDGTATYDVAIRGILNSETANPPTEAYTNNFKAHENDALVLIDWTWAIQELNASFLAGTQTATAEAGEALTAQNSVSLHTDNKLYKYHATNYPNRVGIVNDAYSSGETATYTKAGGVSSGHTGLTAGAIQYAENTGAITETSSATTVILGQAISATTIVVIVTSEPREIASQAEAEAGTDNTKAMTPL
jgi:hypothetical protein